MYPSGSSYPTYEEWKHGKLPGDITGNAGSYPTYEEWKLDASSDWKLYLRNMFLSYL